MNFKLKQKSQFSVVIWHGWYGMLSHIIDVATGLGQYPNYSMSTRVKPVISDEWSQIIRTYYINLLVLIFIYTTQKHILIHFYFLAEQWKQAGLGSVLLQPPFKEPTLLWLDSCLRPELTTPMDNANAACLPTNYILSLFVWSCVFVGKCMCYMLI